MYAFLVQLESFLKANWVELFEHAESTNGTPSLDLEIKQIYYNNNINDHLDLYQSIRIVAALSRAANLSRLQCMGVYRFA